MYSKKYVIPLVIILLIIFFSPLIYNASAPGFEKEAPTVKNGELAKPEGDHCIENATWMKAWHMDLIHNLRTEAIRHQDITYTSEDYGETYNASLNTCWECHESKEDFCNACHEYTGVKPYCFECHITPELIEKYK